jgi:hypothetical protein
LNSTEPPTEMTFRWAQRTYSWPTRCVVPKVMVLRALRAFFETGVAAEELYWESVSHEVFEEKRAL